MEKEVTEMETSLQPIHHLLHLLPHKHLHPLPLTQPLLVLIIVLQKELVNHLFLILMLNSSFPCIMVK
ncbi:hypothetical protein, partial [Actinobacillus pleuropneumoniae]